MEPLLKFLIENGISWVSDQRARFRPVGSPIGDDERRVLGRFFTLTVLDSVRVAWTPRIENPPFYSVFEQAGQEIPLDFTQMAGITFSDTVLVSELHCADAGPYVSLLFHELVHVIQYSYLGTPAFLDRYVRGWAANNLLYAQIPLEAQAFELQHRFDLGSAGFDVEADVAWQLGFTRRAT